MTKPKIEWTEHVWNPITDCTGKVALAEKALLKPLKRRKPTTYFVNSMGDLFHEDVPDDWIDQVFAVMALCPQHTFQVLTKRADRMREYVKSILMRSKSIANTIPRRYIQIERVLQKPILPNVWLGVSAEDQTRADERIPALLDTPAAIRFVSCEPLLGPVDIGRWISTCYECGESCGLRLADYPAEELCSSCGEYCNPGTEPKFSEGCPKCGCDLEPVCPDCRGFMVHQHPDTPNLNWVIVGGESGPNARPMHPDWARDLRDQCEAAGTAFFFKQWGEWMPISEMSDDEVEALHFPAPPTHPDASQRCKHDNICLDVDGVIHPTGTRGQTHRISDGAFSGPKPMSMLRVGKKAAGRLLDGREWDGMPVAVDRGQQRAGG